MKISCRHCQSNHEFLIYYTSYIYIFFAILLLSIKDYDDNGLIAFSSSALCQESTVPCPGQVVILNPHSKQEILIPLSPPDISTIMQWHPIQDRLAFLYYINGSLEIGIFDLSENKLVRTITTPDEILAFSWSPDGRKLAYTARKQPAHPFQTSLFIVDVDTELTRSLNINISLFGKLRWSPDGKYIASNGRFDGQSQGANRLINEFTDVFALEVENEDWLRIGSYETHEYNPEWTINGKYLIYISGDYKMQQLFMYDTEMHIATQLTNNPDQKINPRLVLGDTAILYHTIQDDETHHLRLFDLNTQQVTTILTEEQISGSSISPDGNHLAFIERNGDETLLCVIDISASDKWCAQNKPFLSGRPAWGD